MAAGGFALGCVNRVGCVNRGPAQQTENVLAERVGLLALFELHEHLLGLVPQSLVRWRRRQLVWYDRRDRGV